MRAVFLSKAVIPALIIAGGLGFLYPLNRFVTKAHPQLPSNYGDSDLTFQGSKIRGFALGMEGLLADWYFMRSLQYVGDKLLASKEGLVNIDDLRGLDPRLLYPLLDNATRLDPHYMAAYSYGSVLLPAIDADKAIELTTRGIENNPDSWELYQHLGYIYWKLGRYQQASDTYAKGSELRGAPHFMKLMAASMKKDGGSRETARAIYREMLQSSEDERVRVTAKRRLAELLYLDQRDAVDRILDDLRQRNGHCASSFDEIMPSLLKVELPEHEEFSVDASGRLADPTGAPYVLDKNECRVKVDPLSSTLPAQKSNG